MQREHTSTSTYQAITALPPEVKNYLFIVPSGLSAFESAVLQFTASRMARQGYVYVADARQHEMEDRDGVRYIPMRNGVLPHFGSLESVIIFHDAGFESEARALYPEARIFLLNPAPGETSASLSFTRELLPIAA